MADDKPIPVPSPRVARFEKMAFGIFLHFGLYSQMERGEWTENAHKIPRDDYLKLMNTFTAKDFSGRNLAKLAKKAGAKYITLTTRHHEGFSLYDTRGLSPLDVTHTPAKRDLIKDFVTGCRAEGIVPMFYHTTLDWNDPRFEKDFPAYLHYLRDSIEVLCTHYGPVGGFWFDGNWSKPNDDWQEDRLYAVIRKYQPEAMIINNTGIGEMGKLGNPEIDSVTFERGRPAPLDRRGHPKYVAAEMCHTLNYHWGTAAKDFNYLSPAHVIEELCYARRAGANLLMNMGPTATGGIPEYEGAVLHKAGDWIRMCGGDAGPIYQGRATGISGDGDDFALELNGDLYLFIFELSATSDTRVHTKGRGAGKRPFKGVAKQFANAVWMDNGEKLQTEYDSNSRTLTLDATCYPYGTNTVVRVAKVTS
jgi:alpha-L-fucosidase